MVSDRGNRIADTLSIFLQFLHFSHTVFVKKPLNTFDIYMPDCLMFNSFLLFSIFCCTVCVTTILFFPFPKVSYLLPYFYTSTMP